MAVSLDLSLGGSGGGRGGGRLRRLAAAAGGNRGELAAASVTMRWKDLAAAEGHEWPLAMAAVARVVIGGGSSVRLRWRVGRRWRRR